MTPIRSSVYGLSPLARGTLPPGVRVMMISRFIPAGAGNTRARHFTGPDNAVYPRWRGEHFGLFDHQLLGGGLSPLARGTLVNGLGMVGGRRFIPAGAGNTCCAGRLRTIHSVYPRWRGEHSNRRPRVLRACGLSPLARGTRACARLRVLSSRFIPAGAGNTARLSAGKQRRPVYPRWRGEHISE